MVSEVISVLCFRLLPPSPYELGDELLCQARCESLLLSYRTLLNGVCSSLYKYEEWEVEYQSVGFHPRSIAFVCVLLTWTFAYPEESWPSSLMVCENVCYWDAQGVLQIVREMFPMMTSSCDIIEKAVQKHPLYRVSPTSRFLVCYKHLNSTQTHLNLIKRVLLFQILQQSHGLFRYGHQLYRQSLHLLLVSRLDHFLGVHELQQVSLCLERDSPFHLHSTACSWLLQKL